MKKIIKGILVGLLGLCFATDVNAANYTVSQVPGTQSLGSSCKGCYAENTAAHAIVNNFVTIPYNVNYNGGKYAVYCLDANSPDISEMKEIPFDANNKYHVGLLAIASHDKAYYNSNLTSLADSDKNSYSSTNLALRMWKIAMGNAEYGNITVGGTKALVNAIGKTAANVMAENAVIAKKATGYNCSTAECFYNKMGLSTGFANTQAIYGAAATDLLPNAKEMFIAALNMVANGTSGTGSASSDVNRYGSPIKADTDTHFVQSDIFKIDIVNFGADNYLKNINVSCKNCSSLSFNPTISSRYSLDGTNWNNGLPSNETLKTINGTKSIYIEVTSKIGRDSGYQCEELNINISYSYYAPTSDKSILILEPAQPSNGQDFAAVIPDGGSDDDNPDVDKDFDVTHCVGNYCEYYTPEELEDMSDEEFEKYTTDCCTDLKDFCEDSTQKGRESYCELYSEYCAACESEIIVPNVCTFEKDETTGEVTAIDQKGSTNEAIDGNNNTENIKFCLLRRKNDEAGNSYQAMSNNYCQVYCKEEYEFDFPGAEKVNSGTYFQLNATITATKSCYTSEIDTVKYNNDLLSATTQSDKDAIQTQYNACIDMTVNYDCFEPVVEFEYDEIYNDLIENNGKNKFEKISEEIKDNKITTKYYSDINDQYEGTELSKTDSNVKYVKSTITKVAKYTTPSVFYQQRPTGEITLDGSLDNTVVINGLPIAKNSKYTNSYTLQLKDIGEYYSERSIGASNGSSCSLGRLIDDDTNSVYKEQNKDNTDINGAASYKCYYDVNCPECDFDCEGPLCDIDDCDGPECTAICLGNGCAYDNDYGLSYAYRTVSLNSLSPSGRQLGYNWNNIKGAAAIGEIENKGEEAYSNPEYVITLTPALIQEIKTYNKSQINNGGYANNSLEFVDYTESHTGKTYELLYGESKLLKELNTGSFRDNVSLPSELGVEAHTSWLESDYCKTYACDTKLGPAYK